jgi:UDP-N-acetylmuramyl pentapeptide phosphotransferase/UDP-N-acetylglucosamine-1-phosphate transferase
MNNLYITLFLAALVILEQLYFRVARHYSILDHPNNRSLHDQPTIRGGGVIFYLAASLFYALALRPSPLFIVALTMVSVVGFIDDVRSLSSMIRLLVQLVAFVLVLMDVEASSLDYLMIALVFVVSVGALNTFNFMDGINGLTGAYGLVALGSLLYVNSLQVHFIESDFIGAIILSVLVFCYFNFRKKAVCFAGDVGSMALGFIVIYLIVKLVMVSDNIAYAFFLSVYGVDSVLTIIQRILRKENIFEPHKLHLFQVTVNHYQIPHLKMSSLYALVQLVINAGIVYSLALGYRIQFLIGVSAVLILAGIYLFVKLRLIGTSPTR